MSEEIQLKDLIKLNNFKGGLIWERNIENAKKKAVLELEKISDEKLDEIFDLILAKKVNLSIFEDSEWTILLNPLPDFIIYITFMLKDEEFPSDMKIFYSKSSLSVPTEDAYVITDIYLNFLVYLANSEILFEIESDQLISLEEFCKNSTVLDAKKVYHDIITQREVPLKEIKAPIIKKIVKILDMEYIEDFDEKYLEWVVKEKLFKDLDIYYLKINENNEIKFNIYMSISILHYDPILIFYYLWIPLNAIIREARKIMGDSLTKISKYL
ncbi:MAG: DUF3786 domain-containing protein [Candidatus Lokiarchaeota archaeon]|nr:DUF3786 domain-containing protein [Candidatus Lokiarchaeota archaeon]